MRKSVQHRMLIGAGGFVANPDGPFLVEFCKTTTILGTTLLANDVIPNGATIISIQAFVGGTGILSGGNVLWSQTSAPPFASSFSYTIQDNVTAQTSTATVTLTPFNAVTSCVDDGPGFDTATEFHPLILSKFGPGTITSNDTFGGAAPANPVTATVLTPSTPAYATLFDSSTPGIFTLVIPPGINQIEIETWGAEGGRGGFHVPGPGGGPVTFPGPGAHRLVEDLSVTPGQILSIAVGSAGVAGLDTAPPPAIGGNIGSGGAGGLGFADNLSFGSRLADDSFGFRDGSPSGAGMCPACQGAGGGAGQDAPVDHTEGAGGGGGAGSAVTEGDATINTGVPLNQLGPVLSTSGGGGGGSGHLTDLIGRDPTGGQPGGPPASNRVPSGAFFGSRGEAGGFGGATAGGTGGGGGGYRGGDSDPTTDPTTGLRRGFGGESNDERYDASLDRLPGAKLPNTGSPSAASKWLRFSGSTTTEFASLQAGNGRVRIGGRTVVDQLGGTQFPINCKVVDLGATIQVTPDVPFEPSGFSGNECSFFYFLTDTKTGETSGVCQVRMDIVANVVIAANDGPFNILENSSNVVVASVATLLANDSLTPAEATVTVDSFSGNISAASVSGGNLRVTTGPFASGATGTVTYRIRDNAMPAGFERIINRADDTADVSINITMPCTSSNFNGGSFLEGSTVDILKTTLAATGSCGTQSCIFNDASGPTVNLLSGPTDIGASIRVVIGSAGTISTYRFRIRNAAGQICTQRTVSITPTAPAFSNFLDTGSHTGSATTGALPAPSAGKVNEVEITVWGAEGGDGGSFTSGTCSVSPGGSGGLGGQTIAVIKLSGVGAAGAGYTFDYHCGTSGFNGGNSDGGCGFPTAGSGGGSGAGSGNLLAYSTVGTNSIFTSASGGAGHGGGSGAIATCARGGGGGGGGGSGVGFNTVAGACGGCAGKIIVTSGGGGGGRGGGTSSPGGTQSGGAGNFGSGSQFQRGVGEPNGVFGPFAGPGCETARSGIGGAGGGYTGGRTAAGLSGGSGPTGAEGGADGSDFPGGFFESFTNVGGTQTGNGRVRIRVRERLP